MQVFKTNASERTGGCAFAGGIGCGATGAEGVVSAQNQPILTREPENEYQRIRERSCKVLASDVEIVWRRVSGEKFLERF